MIWIAAPHGQLYKMLLLDKLVVHFENIRRLPWNGGLLCMQRWLSTWASIEKILTPQASYLLLLLWGKWLWIFGTCSFGASGSEFLVLAPTWKGPASTNKWCAVLCCLGASTVVLLKLQWSIWHMIATSINVICNIMHILGHICKMLHHDAHLWHCCWTVRPDSQTKSSKRFPIGQSFPGFSISHFIHAQQSNILTVLASPPHLPHEKEQYQCPA